MPAIIIGYDFNLRMKRFLKHRKEANSRSRAARKKALKIVHMIDAKEEDVENINEFDINLNRKRVREEYSKFKCCERLI